MTKIKKVKNDSSSVFGGDKKDCCILTNISTFVEREVELQNIMEAIQSLIEKTNRLDIPQFLDARTSTDIDVGIHAYFIQRLGVNTIEKHIRYKRFMETYEVPVCFFPPEYDNFARHMRYREFQGAGFYALKHEKQAIMMYARAFNLGKIFKEYRLPREPEKSNYYDVPFPYDVIKFSTFQYFPNIKSYKNKLFQTMHFHNWMVGYRAPSEMAIMKIDNVKIDQKGNGTLSIVQPKRHNSVRRIVLPKSVLSSSVHKSYKNYIDNVRPKVANQYSKDYLYLKEDGKPYTVRYLGHRLSETGKMVYPSYHPYMARHWCCIAKLIETKVKTGHFDYYYVNRWIGHKSIETTMEYVAPAGEYYDIYPYDWFNHALRPHKVGKRDFPNRLKKQGLLGKVSPVEIDGLGEI